MTRFYLSPFLRYITTPKISYVAGHYVYEWLDDGVIFYLGTGINRRAWNEHLPTPEKRRRDSVDFQVRIFKHGLTKDQAHLIERHRTKLLISLGTELLNTRIMS